MRIIVILTVLCLSSLLLTACGERYCSGFPEHLTDYFPYKMGDKLSFVNQQGDTTSFNIRIVASEEYYESKCGKCACGPPNLTCFMSNIDGLYPEMMGYISAGSYQSYFVFKLDGNLMGNIGLLGKDAFDIKNNAMFGETVVVENERFIISKVTIVKSKGITDFYDQIDNLQWKSINK